MKHQHWSLAFILKYLHTDLTAYTILVTLSLLFINVS